jgi:anti-anti-sigma factor
MTLRISIHEEPEATVLRIEGRVAGPWVDELDRAWQSVAASLGSKKLLVDLTGITHMDTAGRRILADIHKRTGAEFVADSPMTKYFAEEARCNKKDCKEEK